MDSVAHIDIAGGALEAAIGKETWALRDGTSLTLRPAQEGDAPGVRAFVDGLSKESRYFRFLSGARVTDKTIGSLAAQPRQDGVALLLTAPVGEGEAVVGSAQYVVADGRVAEFAVVVGDDFQGQGLGRRLIHRLRLLADAAGLAGMRGDVLSENRRMLAIVRDCGFTTRRNLEDATVYDVSLSLRGEARKQTGTLPAESFQAG